MSCDIDLNKVVSFLNFKEKMKVEIFIKNNEKVLRAVNDIKSLIIKSF